MHTTRTTKRGTLAVSAAAILASALLLSGCTNADPTPSSSTTGSSSIQAPSSAKPSATGPSTVGPPASDTDAKAAATEVAKLYWSTEDKIYNDGGANPERIDQYSTGQAKTDVHDAAGRLMAKKGVIKGQRGFEVTESYSSDLTVNGGQPIKHGFVGLTVCDDISASQPVNADGSPGNKGTVMRAIITTEVQYDPVAKHWVVTQVPQPTSVITC